MGTRKGQPSMLHTVRLTMSYYEVSRKYRIYLTP
jgi:hypothetical protein